MDVLSFLDLAESVQRVQAQEDRQNHWFRMIAAQGTSEGMQKALKPLNAAAEVEEQNDLSRLVSKLGKGV